MSSDRSVEQAVGDIYRPILRGYFAVYGFYYSVMLVLNWLSMAQGWEFSLLQTATLTATFLAFVGASHLRVRRIGWRAEFLLFAMNAVVVANVYTALILDFMPEKLTYFIIAAMLFALASTTFRQSCASIGLALVAMSLFSGQIDQATMAAYGFLTFGAALSSLAISFYLRKAVARIAEANLKARDELAAAEEIGAELREQSLSDSLTGLPNRRAFFNVLNQEREQLCAVSSSDHSEECGSWLISIDLDGFKAVNDIHGHLTGDQLLAAVADRLRAFTDSKTHLSRMGGDEFNMIVTGSATLKDVQYRCQKLLEEIARPYHVDGRKVLISCSAGCVKMDPKQESRTLISHADYALMVAKKEGKNRLVMFDKDQAKQADTRFNIENALRSSDLAQELSVVFQPQFRLGDNELVGAEVLARWSNDKMGTIPPQDFIQIAEESGLVANITLIVIDKALSELSKYETKIPLAINLSGNDLMSDPVISEIIGLVNHHGVEPALIEFEVTETAMMSDMQTASRNLDRLSQLGFSIALDDFGTGYSNFNYLRSLPIKRLKVDKSFTENPGDPMAEKILASLVGMARVLEVNCLLEGVESELTLLMAKRAGAELVQGYLFGKPMSAQELWQLLPEDANTSDRRNMA